MRRTREAPARQVLAALRRLRAVGEDAPNLDEKCRILATARTRTAGMDERLDRTLLEDADRLRCGLMEAHENLRQLKELLDKVTAPPWHVGVYLRPLGTAEQPTQRVMVQHSNARRVVNLAEGVDPSSLAPGDLVFLNDNLTAVLAKGIDQFPQVGETATFSRRTADGRVVVRCRDEEIVLDPAGPLLNVELKEGDSLRIDRAAWMAYEKLERTDSRRYLMDEVPDVRAEQVGGQQTNLESLLAALTTTLVSPDKAKMYGLSGRRSILMIGPPGCGKTLMARVAAAEVVRSSGQKCRFAVVKPSQWEDPYVGVTQQNIRHCFQSLREAAQDGLAVLFMDEIECAGRIRGSAAGHHSDKFLAALLAELDGFTHRDGVALICATNRKDLVDPALLERISDLEIQVGRPNLRGAAEIFRVHLPESLPYHANGQPVPHARQAMIERAVSQFFAPNAENHLCTLKFRDGKTRAVAARELLSGRAIEQICRTARQRAFLRDVRREDPGLRGEDLDEAVCETIARMSTTLTPQNASVYLTDLPQDIDVVAVEPAVRRVSRAHRYLN